MEWIVNSEVEDYQTILFEYDGHNWEITIDKGLSDREIKLLIMKRIDVLTDDFLQYGNYDLSDLIVDYTKITLNNGNTNNQ